MFQGIPFVLHTGIAWEHLPQELGFGSGMTCWRRLAEWTEAGVWPRLHEVLLARVFTTAVAILVPATAVCWLRLFNQVTRRPEPIRRRRARVWWLVSRTSAALEAAWSKARSRAGKHSSGCAPRRLMGTGAVRGQVVAAAGEELQVHRDLVALLQGLRVTAHSCPVGDDVGVFRVGPFRPPVTAPALQREAGRLPLTTDARSVTSPSSNPIRTTSRIGDRSSPARGPFGEL